MSNYATLDHLPDLTFSQMVWARSLAFQPHFAAGTGWDRVASVNGLNSNALLHSVYKFTAVAGATYDLFSTSYFDPFLLRIFDSQGNAIVANHESDDGAPMYLSGVSYDQDVIFNWVAPYSGTYYVEASWNQGSFFKYYSLNIYEDKDTASASSSASNVIASLNAGNPTPSTHGLTGDEIIDAMTTGYKWLLDGTRVIDFSISSGFSGEYWNNPSEVAASLKAALATFSDFANVKFNYLGQFVDPTQAARAGSEINLSLDSEWTFFSAEDQWARAFFPNPSNTQSPYTGAAGDVYLNINSDANSLPSYSPGSAGWFLLLHELGHSLGLKHPHDDGGTDRPTLSDIGFDSLDMDWATIMSYNDDAFANLVEWDPATPMVLDVLALQHLYGPNTSTHAGTSMHVLQDKDMYSTLWDASGTDTLMLSLATEGWTILLPDIQLSTSVKTLVGLAAPTQDLATSVPTTLTWLLGDMENVRGSSYDDWVHNNRLRNDIDGDWGVDHVIYKGDMSAFRMKRTPTGIEVTDRAGTTDTLKNVERLVFDDMGLNLTVKATASTLPTSTVARIMELYIAFFNRTPDADGLEYWIGQARQGMSIDSIAETFYVAGTQYAALTGFSSSMRDADFVNVIYRNVLGRSEGADAGGLQHWTQALQSGASSRGTLVSTILTAAHGFKGDATWGWVANLLNNKVTVANTLAVDWGLNFSSPEQAITQGMAIAAAITPTDSTTAIELVGLPANPMG
jgi:serralysin